MINQKVWFITGCSSGLGKALANRVLKSGANVVVTGRKLADINHFATEFPNQVLVMNVDVTNTQQIRSAVDAAKNKFGHIDVLVNNAGIGIFGAIEEIPDKEVRNIFETNFFGTLNMIKAILPIMRAQKSGHIINVTALGGIVATQCLGIFNATKFAIEGLSESLEQEVSPIGIKITLIEPGPTRTPFMNSMKRFESINDYNESREFIKNIIEQYGNYQPGDPEKIAQTIMEVANNPVPPLHLLMGKFSVERTREKLSNLSETITEWEKISCDTDYK
jgi:NAD(P)-dependent dehydrogenase (short-subunit alcohol dehydrogenase family)